MKALMKSLFSWIGLPRTLVHETAHALAAGMLGAGVRRVLVGTNRFPPGRRFVLLLPDESGFNGGGLCVNRREVGTLASIIIDLAGFFGTFVTLSVVLIVFTATTALVLWLEGMDFWHIYYGCGVLLTITEAAAAAFSARGCEGDFHNVLYEAAWRRMVGSMTPD